VTVEGVTPGAPPEVATQRVGGDVERLRARLVVGADGRTSRVRGWAGFAVRRDPEFLTVGGVLMRDLRLPEDAVLAPYHPALGQRVLIFPLGAGRFRAYLIHRALSPARRLSGRRHVPDFVATCVETGCDEAWFAGAEAVGPLAMFAGADTWVDHPYRGGVVLVGDAAAASDPSWGCGLAQTLRDVRVLRNQLLATGDWEAAGHAYAAEHDRYYAALHRIETWLAELFYAAGPEADARRARVLPRLAQDPGRAPDLAAGPDGPNGAEELRAFG
jgi:2-polyprenyl-6-methoxyphenol hydroxylase-like FAD-dependent oxidoreductase